MAANPIYRVSSMEAHAITSLYSHEVVLEPIPEDEAADLAAGRVSEEGYERKTDIRMNVTQEVFHSLRVGMVYQVAFNVAELKEVA